MSSKLGTLLIALFSIVLSGCEEDDVVDCSAVLCSFQRFTLELIDADGNNLIENGTYTLDTIEVIADNGDRLDNKNFSENEIVFFVTGQNGANNYQVRLNNDIIDTLVLDLTIDSPGSDCCPGTFLVKTATYNNENQEILREERIGTEKIVVVKP